VITLKNAFVGQCIVLTDVIYWSANGLPPQVQGCLFSYKIVVVKENPFKATMKYLNQIFCLTGNTWEVWDEGAEEPFLDLSNLNELGKNETCMMNVKLL